jgi:hypothetical protein
MRSQWRCHSLGDGGRRRGGSSGGWWSASVALVASDEKGKALGMGRLRRQRPERVLTENGAVDEQGTGGGENIECG